MLTPQKALCYRLNMRTEQRTNQKPILPRPGLSLSFGQAVQQAGRGDEDQMTTRAQFERGLTATTIAPTPFAGRTLKEQGWRFIIRDMDGNVVAERDPDQERARILRGFGHKI